MRLSLLFLVLILFFSCSDEQAGGTVATENPGFTAEGTLVLIPKNTLSKTANITFEFYDKEARPWAKDILKSRSMLTDSLVEYNDNFYAVDLARLTWSSQDQVDSTQFLNLLISADNGSIQLIQSVKFKEFKWLLDFENNELSEFDLDLIEAIEWSGNITFDDYSSYVEPFLGFKGTPFYTQADNEGNFQFVELPLFEGELIATTTPIILSEGCPCQEPGCCPSQGELILDEIQDSPLLEIEGEVDFNSEGNLVLTSELF